MLTGLLCYLPLLTLVQGLFVSPYVKNIPQSDLRKYIAQSDFLSAVITYSDSTKLCEEMEPHLTKVAETYANFMKTYAVECSTMEEPKCTPEMAAKLPGLQLYFPYGFDPETGQTLLYQDRYTGQLSMKAFGDYLIGKMPYYGNILTSATIDPFLNYPGLNKTILFTDKDQVSGLYKAMTAQFRARLDFAVVWKNETSLVEKYGVKWFPTLLTLAGGKQFEYDGELNFDDLKWYLGLHASKERLQDRLLLSPYNHTEESKPASSSNYTASLNAADKTVITLFHEGGETPQLWTDWRYLYQGLLTFLDLDCSNAESRAVAQQYGITSFPSYLLQPEDKAKPAIPVDSTNIADTLRSLYQRFIVDFDNVTRTQAMDFMKGDERVVSILVADEVLPQFQALASDAYLRQYIVFGHSRLQKEYLLGQIKVPRLPAVISMRVQNESDLHVLEYNGRAEDYSNLKYFYEEQAITFYHNYSKVEKEDYEEELVDELYSRSFQSLCGRKSSSTCVIALLDGEFVRFT